MAGMPRPGCVLRSALVTFGLLFLPIALVFLYRNWRLHWGTSLILIAISIAFLRAGLSHDEDSLMATIDRLGGDE